MVNGRDVSMVVTDEVSGTAMASAARAIDKAEGGVKDALARLAVTYPSDQIVRADYLRRAGGQAEVYVRQDVAFALAGKSPDPPAAIAALVKLISQTGGKVPLHSLSLLVGPWDSLLEEVFRHRRPR